MRRRSAIPLLLIGGLLGACAASYSAWELERAERHFSDGRPEQALRHTERAIQLERERANDREIALHVALLRALGREAEAEAFADYAERYARGEHEGAGAAGPSGAECTGGGGQDGAGLVAGWGGPRIYPSHDVGTLAARFQIDAEGRVGSIRVLRARHPAEAWLIIQAVADAQISSSRLARRRERAPSSFPVSLCASWDPRQQQPPVPPGGIPPGGCIRGFCTHAPGTAPHM